MSARTHNGIRWPELIVLTLTYALYILLITAPIGFVISAMKVARFKKVARNSDRLLNEEVILIATHYEWLARTFIFMVVLVMASVGLAYYMVGFVIGGLAAVWWFYRVIRGMVALLAHRSVPAIICTQVQCYGQGQSA